MSRNGRRKQARLYDFRDLDLMLKISDMGGAETPELASALGFGKDVQPIAVRLAWMRRFGMLDYDGQLWELSSGGLRVTRAKLQAAQASALQAMPEEAMVEAMAYVTSRYHRSDAMLAHMLRREFLYGTKPR
jgi:hypothetical protein